MEITLYSGVMLYNYKLPKEISGSFSFDPNDNESNLINIKAKNGKWVLFSTTDVDVLSGGQKVDDVELIPNSFYLIRREGIINLIYAHELKMNNTIIYTYDGNYSFLIGNGEKFNINYNCPYLNNSAIKVSLNNNVILVETQGKVMLYHNKQYVNSSKFNINYGDELELYGLRFLFLNGYILVNNIDNKVIINESSCNIRKKIVEIPIILQNSEIKDLDLYTNDEYYSKAPRMRRGIKIKNFRIVSPPSMGDQKQLPAILTLGPMFTMAIISVVTFTNTITRILSNKTTMSDAWPSLVTSSVMLTSSLVWPTLTRVYTKKLHEKQKKKMLEKYNKYLVKKEEDLKVEANEQKIILSENLMNITQCLNLIKNRGIGFWNKRIEENDFLVARLGLGSKKLAADIHYDVEEFSLNENELKDKVSELAKKYETLENVPIGYSFYSAKTTAIMGLEERTIPFVYNILLQFLTFYSYEDLKVVVFTNQKNKKKWEFLKYLNHNFNNDRTFRYFASDSESAKAVADNLGVLLNQRMTNSGVLSKPQYFIIIDGYDNVKRYDFVKQANEIDAHLGFNMVIIENKFNKLPSKCNNFILLSDNRSEILKNANENSDKIIFNAEYLNNVNMNSITSTLSNVPIEFEEDFKKLPDAIDFLEMENVSKVEQLNILNRWNMHNSSDSLRAEIGVDERGDLMYLDLHEKAHGPHGLIAGMTGSGKSEFIITYILSMAINYSPDDVAFILIDYKGGGLAFAFEKSTQGIVLPHLAGTITNLDKSEMDRTLVSINSELQRRQKIFNEVRDRCGESTIDIYKYQRLFKDGFTNISVPHLFIICDEFAELKSQQPEFMDNLISVARIGRSLGIHLILATQKPTGVVSDQIWSNSKFRVCLKVQDESDSKEMLKRPDAAGLKQTGRFYLQVGYDEYFALGQTGWCGAKYYPTDKVIKKVDKSVNFINDFGSHIKSIQASTQMKVKAEGDQLSAILKSIISVAQETNKRARKLWLDNVPEIIIEDELRLKYGVNSIPYEVSAIIGEYDAPECQEQGVIKYNYLEDGNTIIYGNDGSENEMLLNTLIYSTTNKHKANEINYYIIDYGSESLRKFTKLPHVGGLVFASDNEKFKNLMKLIREEISRRKRLFVDYNGEFKYYNSISLNKLPIITIIINNYDSLYEEYPSLYDELPEIVRDSTRYGIVFIFTCNSSSSIHSKITQNCSNIYTLKMKDASDYSIVLGGLRVNMPRDVFGRGIVNNNGIHEFQVANITRDNINEFIIDFVQNQIKLNDVSAKAIPMVPKYINYDVIKQYIDSINNVPVGINKEDLSIVKYDFNDNPGTIISSNNIESTNNFILSLLEIFIQININIKLFDPNKLLNVNTEIIKNYYFNNFDNVVDELIINAEEIISNGSDRNNVIVIYGLDKFIKSLTDPFKFNTLAKAIKKCEKINIIIVDSATKIKFYAFDEWFTTLFNNNDGIWIGRGISNQNIIRLSTITKEMTKDIKSEMGFVIDDNYASLCKLINFINKDGDDDEE